MPGCDPRVAQISREILAYLSRHPGAGDTLEGVVQWWLLDQMVIEQTGFVEQALAQLVSEGLLVESVDAGSRSRFRLNPARRLEIADVVKEETEMPLRIKNRSRRLVTVELNTRESAHLAPGEVSRPLEDYEVTENRQLEKLVARGEIEKVADNSPSAGAVPVKKSARSSPEV